MKEEKLISVIVPTRNSAEYLATVLESIKNQTYKNIEIIVIDNNSKDQTKKIAKKYTKKIYNKGSERSTQKNSGAQIANGDYLLFLDSDAQLTKNVISECVELANQNFDMVIIPERHVGTGFWTKAKALERQCFLNDDSVEAPWFFKKTSLLAVNGYDEKMFAGEDWDLFERMKKKEFRYTRNASFINHQLGHLHFWKMIKKKHYYGKNLCIFINQNHKAFLKKIPFFRPAYLKNWKLLIKHPFLTIGFILLKLGETFFVFLGIINYKFNQIKLK